MGLTIGIGELVLAAAEGDPESLDSINAAFDAVSAVLEEHGLTRHVEPSDFEIPLSRSPIESFPYSRLHCLRRFAAHVWKTGKVPGPVTGDQCASDDSVLETMYSPKYHLLYHSDCEGFYVPVDFATVIVDERIRGHALGSSHRLMKELLQLAPYLQIALNDGSLGKSECEKLMQIILEGTDPYVAEKTVWLSLFDAAEQSLRMGSAIVFA